VRILGREIESVYRFQLLDLLDGFGSERRFALASMASSVRAAPGCTLMSVTAASATDAGTRVSESVTVTASRLLVGHMYRHARLARQRTYSLLPQALAAAPG
jgi:hypothetical protein